MAVLAIRKAMKETKTGPRIVPMLLAAPNCPIPADLFSSVVTSATVAPVAGLIPAPSAELITRAKSIKKIRAVKVK